jgi:hypothetical protein
LGDSNLKSVSTRRESCAMNRFHTCVIGVRSRRRGGLTLARSTASKLCFPHSFSSTLCNLRSKLRNNFISSTDAFPASKHYRCESPPIVINRALIYVFLAESDSLIKNKMLTRVFSLRFRRVQNTDSKQSRAHFQAAGTLTGAILILLCAAVVVLSNRKVES